MDLINVLSNFKLEGKILNVRPYGNGHINITYLVTTTKKRYILQQMNTNIFPDHKSLINNIINVTNHLKNKNIETLNLIYTNSDKPYLEGDKCYRVYDFIENTITYQKTENKNTFKNSGYAFGEFQNHLSDFDATSLTPIIKDFHNTSTRYKNLLEAIKKDPIKRVGKVKKEIDFINKNKEDYSIIIDCINEGKIPLRVTHNDTKLNNILFDKNSLKPRAIIDFDTIMAGSLLFDFGDSIRFGASTALEDEKDLRKVNFSLDLYNEYLKGYLSSVYKTITKKELELLGLSAYLMTIECGIRFLTDYILGDIYFTIKYPDHNLVRTRTQLKLAKQIKNNLSKMNKLTKKVYLSLTNKD